MDKKKEQLGMNPSTASHRLVKDILWSLIVKTDQNKCYRCSKEMSRDTFSIEHKESWIDSEDPVGLYFSLDNIAFSHLKCNVAAGKRMKPWAKCGTVSKYASGCRCNDCKEAKKEHRKERYDPEERKKRYLKNGT